MIASTPQLPRCCPREDKEKPRIPLEPGGSVQETLLTWTGVMPRWVKTLATHKPGNLNAMPDPTRRWTERINFTKVSSDLHKHTHTRAHTLVHIHTILKKILQRKPVGKNFTRHNEKSLTATFTSTGGRGHGEQRGNSRASNLSHPSKHELFKTLQVWPRRMASVCATE